ncbi:DUF6537 domain-containing protein, partial [Rhizobium leguminosarum]|uniref:DUF6537 domain-containing protein n=1 Tax=Rhizobium leguminosarum TaxID=384 RepID=UPI003F97ADE7
LVIELSQSLDAGNPSVATELAGLPDMIRGFGHVKLASIQLFEKLKNDLLAKWRASARAYAPDADLRGVSVQEMVTGGVEALV